MKTTNEIQAIRMRLQRRADALDTYRLHCMQIKDHHGVQDASSDLREIVAVDNALLWVLGLAADVGV